jgi:hypothetical protein
MNAHVSSILLGVRDMDRSKWFYTEGRGWNVQRVTCAPVGQVPVPAHLLS